MARILGGRLIPTACVVGLTLACFGPALFQGRQFAYRDFSDFYYPLYQRVQQEWDAGRLPLWSSEENGGSPILANPTSAVLYPGKLIYAGLPYPWAARVYVIAHVLLAFGTMRNLLRRWDVSAVGSALGGLAYAFGAPVLTQYSNIVFLIGAAWMPLGFRFADGWVRLRRPRSLAGLAMVLTLQVLGGDPEAAYMVAVAAGGYAVGRRLRREPDHRWRRITLVFLGLVAAYGCLIGLEVANLPAASGAVGQEVVRSRWHLSSSTAALLAWMIFAAIVSIRRFSRPGRSALEGTLLGLLGACTLALLLSGIQLIPTLEFIGRTTRADGPNAVNFYPQSIHPARIVEWAWPNAFGSPFGVNRSWLTALPPTNDYTVWMTSIYLGGLTTILAVAGAGFRGGPAGRGWLTAVAVVAFLASFGNFGSPIFWARALPGTEARLGALEEPEAGATRPDGRLRDGDGGPYWFLASALPGFRSFRYPGKWMVPAALGLAGLAGFGFDGLVAGRRRVALALAWVLLVVGLVGLLAAFLAPAWIRRLLETRSEMARSAFGPFDPAGAAFDLRMAMIQGLAVVVLALVLIRIAPRRPHLAGLLALAGLSADLAWANARHVGTVPQSVYESEPRVLAAIRRAERERPNPGHSGSIGSGTGRR